MRTSDATNRLSLRGLAAVIALVVWLGRGAAAEQPVRFDRDIRPILATHCYQAVDKVVFTSPDLALNFGHRPRADEHWRPRREAWHLGIVAGSGRWRLS
jgi:hypothetical protein